MSENRIKRCPFCNRKAVLHETTGFRKEFISGYIKCEKCGASSATFSTYEGIIGSWNMRYDNKNTERNFGK